MPNIICDFCSSIPVRWRYPAATFAVSVVVFADDWAACDTCHELLERDDRDALLQRSAALAPAPLTELPEGLRQAMIAPIHREFFKYRHGVGVPHVE